jgi:hypothetical protein
MLLALVYLRNFFHLVYFVAVLTGLGYLFHGRRRAVLLAGSVPLVIVLSLYVKNLIVFGTFSGSTWVGMSMDTIAAHQLTPREAQNFVQRGVISPVSLFDVGTPVEQYKPYITIPPPTRIPILDNCVTSTGATNFNCLAFREIQRDYTRDGLALLRAYPVTYLRSTEAAWFTYFLPVGDFKFFDLNGPRIHALDRAWNVVFFGQLEEMGDGKALRRLKEERGLAPLLLHTGIFLMIGLPAVWIWGVVYLVRGTRRGTLVRPSAVLIGFLLFNIAYVTAIANLLSSFENHRYRFPIDGFYLILAGVALEQVLRRVRRYGIAKACNGLEATTVPVPSNRSTT